MCVWGGGGGVFSRLPFAAAAPAVFRTTLMDRFLSQCFCSAVSAAAPPAYLTVCFAPPLSRVLWRCRRSAPCPLCFTPVVARELRLVRVKEVAPPRVGQPITFTLLRRPRGSIVPQAIAAPADGAPAAQGEGQGHMLPCGMRRWVGAGGEMRRGSHLSEVSLGFLVGEDRA